MKYTQRFSWQSFCFKRVCVLLFFSLSSMWSFHGLSQSPTQKSNNIKFEKQFLEQQKKKWPNLSEKALINHLAVIQNTPVYDNPKLARYVQKVGEKILEQTPHAGQDYRFLVLDSPNPNAFTMQQPYIYVNRGLIALYQSEAHLAGVLAHEIGHNIDKGVSKQKRKKIINSIFATSMSILAGNTSVGNAIATQQLYSQAKYSQERELEADRLGANYLYNAGYDPNGLLDGLGSLFDSVQLGLETNTVQYRPRQTHPRNDIRLKKVLREIGELPPGEAFEGRNEFRDAINGMVYGPNVRKNAPDGYSRYVNKTLGITFLYPKQWKLNIKGSKIILKDPEQTLQFKVEIEKTANLAQSSDAAIKAKYPDDLRDIQKIVPSKPKDLGVVATRLNQRVGLIIVGRNTYHFQGLARDNKLSKERDQLFLGMIASFRRAEPKDQHVTKVKRLYFEQLKPAQTFASIAQDDNDKNIGTEAELRVINGYYPKGEAEPGTWIKKIELVNVDNKP